MQIWLCPILNTSSFWLWFSYHCLIFIVCFWNKSPRTFYFFSFYCLYICLTFHTGLKQTSELGNFPKTLLTVLTFRVAVSSVSWVLHWALAVGHEQTGKVMGTLSHNCSKSSRMSCLLLLWDFGKTLPYHPLAWWALHGRHSIDVYWIELNYS